jgi:hypothetical protein
VPPPPWQLELAQEFAPRNFAGVSAPRAAPAAKTAPAMKSAVWQQIVLLTTLNWLMEWRRECNSN